jgi:hypothetical protein
MLPAKKSPDSGAANQPSLFPQSNQAVIAIMDTELRM